MSAYLWLVASLFSEAITKSSESLSKGNDTTVLNLEEKETDGAQIGLYLFLPVSSLCAH